MFTQVTDNCIALFSARDKISDLRKKKAEQQAEVILTLSCFFYLFVFVCLSLLSHVFACLLVYHLIHDSYVSFLHLSTQQDKQRELNRRQMGRDIVKAKQEREQLQAKQRVDQVRDEQIFLISHQTQTSVALFIV